MMMSDADHTPFYSREEEIANALTHGAGLLASLIGVPLLIATYLARGDALMVLGVSVFAASLVAVYTTSTLYHAVPHPRAKRVLRVADHVAIYLLIAGTYTPFTLGVLRGAWGWSMLAAVWTLAALGIFFKVVFHSRFKRLSTAFYVMMGWVIVIALRPMALAMPSAGLLLLAAGGLMYTGGVFFYVRKARYTHAIWHCFVLGGSACHFFAVLGYAA
jgi:hemolysin III